jgi:hypothetical protein
MHATTGDQKLALNQTCRWGVLPQPQPQLNVPAQSGTVRILPVKVLGQSESQPSPGPALPDCETRRYPRVLPSFEDCIPFQQSTLAPEAKEHDWRTISLRDCTDRVEDVEARRAFGLANTLPALESLNIPLSIPRAPEPAALEPFDARTSSAESPALSLRLRQQDQEVSEVSETTRVQARPRSVWSVAWQRWSRQPPHVTLGTAAAVCAASALVVILLAP